MSEVIRPAAKRMADFPFTRDTQWEVLEKAREFYERILERAGDDPEPRREMARIHHRLGRLAWSSSRDGEPVLRQGIAILKDLAKEFPDNLDDRLERSWLHYWLAAWLASDLRFEEAILECRASIAVVEDFKAEFPTDDEYRKAFAIGNAEMGWLLTDVGKFAEAEKQCRAAVVSDGRLGPWARVVGCQNYATLLLRLARYNEAEKVLEEAFEIAEEEMAPYVSPPNTGWGSNIKRLALCHRLIGLHRFYTARFEEAERHLRKAIDPFKHLLGAYPTTVRIPHITSDGGTTIWPRS